jgi:uncharacterized protein (DUF885 family)
MMPEGGLWLNRSQLLRSTAALALGLMLPGAALASGEIDVAGYDALTALFTEWRAFARPEYQDGVPDYGPAAMARKAAALPAWRERLKAIDTRGWPAAQTVDYRLVEAEMNGLDFDLRVLRPWARDPNFYVSFWPSRTDVPSREAPVSEPEILLYDYKFPLARADQAKLALQLAAIPGLLAQARVNLGASNARDLWVFGIRGLRDQAEQLAAWEAGTLTVATLEGAWSASLAETGGRFRSLVAKAREATLAFIAWLEAEAPNKTGPSGVGREHYSWYQQQVHFVPYGWEQETALLTRELEPAHASLKLQEHRNRNLPPLEPAADAAAFDALARARLDRLGAFNVDAKVIPAKPYLHDAIAPQMGSFVPAEKRNFFAQVTMREPMLLYSHDYHWIDLARMRDEPHASVIRRTPSLSNIWDGRAEGFATAFEELLMHCGLYDDNPRARELVWIMLANRAARGLASLRVQANEWTLEQAGHFHARWTPRGWAKAGDTLTAFEQLLYLRQPGYGTSYITGKLLLDRMLMESSAAAEAAGKPFVLGDFMQRFNHAGMIPIPLMREELVAG